MTAPGIAARSDKTALAGLAVGKSPVGKAEAPNPLRPSHPNTSGATKQAQPGFLHRLSLTLATAVILGLLPVSFGIWMGLI